MKETKKLEQLKRISELMDSRFEILGFRFGLDGLIGLIPFVGDFFSTAISIYIIAQGALLGCPPSILARMGLNVLIENLVDMIPVLGNLFDFVWRANTKNYILLETHLFDPKGARFQSRLLLGIISFTLLSVLVGSFALTIVVIQKVLEYFVLATS